MKLRLAFLALIGCLTSPGHLAGQQPTDMRYSGWQRSQPQSLGAISPTAWIRMDTVGTWVLVPGSPADVYRKALHVYGTLKLKVPLADTTSGILGNPGFNHTGGLAGQRMSYWIGCGEGMTGPYADSWRITMAVLSSVERVAKDTTKLRTVVVASAKNLAEGGRVPTDCDTTGHLEALIHSKVQAMPPTPTGNE
jgi:hypothetical protein